MTNKQLDLEDYINKTTVKVGDKYSFKDDNTVFTVIAIDSTTILVEWTSIGLTWMNRPVENTHKKWMSKDSVLFKEKPHD